MIDLIVTVKEKRIPLGETEIEVDGKKYRLHKFQEKFYSNLSDLPTVTVVIAPTGAGKTFAFVLPILYAKNKKYPASPRGLVIAPTNALVEDMYNSFKKLVNAEKITGRTLKEHGSNRAKELINRLKSAEIVVTNPDIVNFVIHGGYHTDNSGKRRFILNFQDWTEFFGKIQYIIFDEYHLYDEEQIANLLVWLLSNHKFFPSIKWFFVSATPESALLKLLGNHQIEFEIIQENLEDSGRIIQGQQKINFIGVSKSYSLYQWIFGKEGIQTEVKEKILSTIKKGKKVLFIFNSLREAKLAEEKLKFIFSDAKIGINTGFETRQKDFNFNPEKFDLIISTSKIEVGVNYPVHLAYIESGKYLRNFLQRIGRIGRGNIESEIFCLTPVSVVEPLKNSLKNNITYYEFTEALNHSFNDKELKERKIPYFIGALLWSVYNALSHQEKKDVIKDLIEQFPYSKILFKLDKEIKNINMHDEFNNLKIFWNSFKQSFVRFRTDSIQWKVLYKTQETEYDIIWILDNAFIEKINKEQKEIVITDFRPKRELIVKGILTPTILDDPYKKNNLQKIGGIDRNGKKEWFEFMNSNYIDKLYLRKLTYWIENTDVPQELATLLKQLSHVFSKKRIEIIDILYDSSKTGEYNTFI